MDTYAAARVRQIEEKYSTEKGATEAERQEAQKLVERKCEMLELLRTERTYATRENAVKALEKAVARAGYSKVRYIIAVNEQGRFAPVVVGMDYLDLAFHCNVTVVS